MRKTSLYCLQSRYYNPDVGRFINADAAEMLLQTRNDVLEGNLFGYCSNDPVNAYDPLGEASIGVYFTQGIFAILYPVQALSIGSVDFKNSNNISSRVARFALESNLKNGEGSQINALRHAIWTASIAKAWGRNIAVQAGTSHESSLDAAKLAFSDLENIKSLSYADLVCDVMNNAFGLQIAGRPLFGNFGSVDIKRIAPTVLNHYYRVGLYVAVKKPNGKYKVVLQKLTQKEFNNAWGRLQRIDANGFITFRGAGRKF